MCMISKITEQKFNTFTIKYKANGHKSDSTKEKLFQILFTRTKIRAIKSPRVRIHHNTEKIGKKKKTVEHLCMFS